MDLIMDLIMAMDIMATYHGSAIGGTAASRAPQGGGGATDRS